MVVEAPTPLCKVKCPPSRDERAAFMCSTSLSAEVTLSHDSDWVVKRTNSRVLVFLQPRRDLCVHP